MPIEREEEVSRHSFSIAYAGNARADDHTMDVEALSPALLAFGKLIREANSEFNGPRSKANVLVTSDFEHKCFNINFDAVIHFIDHVKELLGIFESTKSAKDVLEWVGILPEQKGISFFAYLRWRRGRKVSAEKITDTQDHDRTGLVRVTCEGDGNSIEIHQHVYNLGQNPKALSAARETFTPIGQDGFERIEVRDQGELVDTIEPEETQAILASCNVGLEEADETAPEIETTTAWLSVYSPVYDAAADKWRFRLGKEVVYVDISETQIAENALTRGGALADDAYQVRLEITTPRTRKGKAGKPTFKIVKVIKFVPASPMVQASLFDGTRTSGPETSITT
jgi:hypothetical protein